MKNSTRKVLDKSFNAVAYSSLAFMAIIVCVFLIPIVVNGVNAFVFRATVEHFKFLSENLDATLSASEKSRILEADTTRLKLYDMMGEYEHPKNSGKLLGELDEYRLAAFSSVKGSKQKIGEIFKLEQSERIEALKSLSREIFEPFVKEVELLCKNSDKNGTSFALVDVLKSESDSFAAELKKLVNSEFSELGLLKKSSLRRWLSQYPLDAMASARDGLDFKNKSYMELKKGIEELLGPQNAEEKQSKNLMRQKYGQPRWDMAEKVFRDDIMQISIVERTPEGGEISKRVNTLEYFKSTAVEEILLYIRDNLEKMLLPRYTVYWGFFFDSPFDSNIFGGIYPMILGTFYLTMGAMLIAAPLGIIAAIYFSEYAKQGKLIEVLRACVGTLAGVPSIVFGLFGLAFLINTVKISDGKSVIAGCITLALLILPTIIRSCEEALKAVPQSYREASLGLGASKWKSICTVILPASLPAMFTGIIISMGRAAGETAPIIFTAATSTGAALGISEIFSQPSPALPWNIYNICSEHEMAERVAHVQYGMVLTLIVIVLGLNLAAILMRARLQRKLKS